MTNQRLRNLIRELEQERNQEQTTIKGGSKRTKNKKSKMTKKDAEEMGKQHAMAILENEELKGGNFWGDFKKGFDMVVKPAAKVVKKVAPLTGPQGALLSAGIDAVGYGKNTGGCDSGGAYKFWEKESWDFGAGKKPKPKQKRKQSAKQLKRNNMVKKLMSEYSMTLPEASKYIKDNNLI